MPDASSPRDIMAETMNKGRQSLVPHLATMLWREAIAEVDSSEEKRRFWQRAMTPEQEAQLWQTAMVARGLTPETMTPEQALDIGLGDVGPKVYLDRFDMMNGEGRKTEADVAAWAWKHAKGGPPEPKGGDSEVQSR